MQGFFTFFILFVHKRYANNNLAIAFLLYLWYNNVTSAGDIVDRFFLFAIACAVAFLL